MRANLSIEEALIVVAEKIVKKRKTKLLCLVNFAIFSIAIAVFLPEIRDMESAENFLWLIFLSTVAGFSLLTIFMPVTFNLNVKPSEIIAAIDKAAEKYLEESRLDLYLYKKTLAALKENNGDQARITNTEHNIIRLSKHIELVDKNIDSIKERAINLASAS